MRRGFLITAGLILLIPLTFPATVQAQAEWDLVSFSFNEASAPNYVNNGFLDYTQDTVFSPNDNWFPLIRFLGDGVGSEIETDALSYGHDSDSSLFDAFFSVGLGSQGLPGTDVADEQPPGDRYSDIYASDKSGANTQSYDGDGSSAQIMGLLENASTGVDALDMRPPTSKELIFWSVSASTAINRDPYMAAGASGANIYWGESTDGYSTALPLSLYAEAWDLGLTGADDIDALVVIETGGDTDFDPVADTIYFSLVSGSPSLIAAGVAPFMGGSPADVFMVGAGLVSPIVAASAAELGLAANDELDALDLAIREEILVALPEPGFIPLLASGATLLGLLYRGQRRSDPSRALRRDLR